MKKAKRNNIQPLIIVLGTFILSLIVIFVMSFNDDDKVIFTTKAIENECDYCINEPSCCKDVETTHEAPCDWPTRGYCKPSTCAQIEGKGQRCGWYWIFHNANDNEYKLGTNGPNGYGCMIGASESTMKPRCTSGGAITLAPTNNLPMPTVYIPPQPTPTIEAPPEPTLEPTEEPEPTSIIRIPPNEPTHPVITNAFSGRPKEESVSQGFELPSIQFPRILLPKVQLNFVRINQGANKPLNFIEYLFEKVVYYDKKLENMINTQFNKLIK